MQLKLSLLSSALGPCTYTPQDLSLGNGTANPSISPMHLPSSRLMVITGTLTLLTAIMFLCASITSYDPFAHSKIRSFLFPDSPTNGWFLTEDERAIAVRRIKVRNNGYCCIVALSIMTKENQTGVENKHFKKEQSVLSAIRAEWLLRTCGQDD